MVDLYPRLFTVAPYKSSWTAGHPVTSSGASRSVKVVWSVTFPITAAGHLLAVGCVSVFIHCESLRNDTAASLPAAGPVYAAVF